MQSLISHKSGPINGTFTPPGDKSISHRSIMLGGIAEGVTTVEGLLEGEDVLCTIAALKSLGAEINKSGDIWAIKGVGQGGLKATALDLDMGNSGTAARLLIGLLSGYPFKSRFTGDASLSKRPMLRVITPLSLSGAIFDSQNGCMPLSVTGSRAPKPIFYKSPVASAQVKSAILLAGLSAEGVTKVIEPIATRDHSENMLKSFGAEISVTSGREGDEITLQGRTRLIGQAVKVPGDPSSAAFSLVAALINPGSKLTIKNVGLNPRRTGLIATLIEMGGKIVFQNKRDEGGEPVADLMVESSELKGIDVPAARAPSMIDEYPILAVAAAVAEGTTRMVGLSELRVKESDRLSLMAEGLKRCGVSVEIDRDDLIVHGKGKSVNGGASIETAMDHRIAMSFLILGGRAQEPIRIDDGSFIATSFPGFVQTMNALGAKIAQK